MASPPESNPYGTITVPLYPQSRTALNVLRASDGAVFFLPVADVHNIHSIAHLHALLAPLLDVPAPELIVMHRAGWQVDATLLGLLLEECARFVSSSAASSSNTQTPPLIYVFDRAFLDADRDSLIEEHSHDHYKILSTVSTDSEHDSSVTGPPFICDPPSSMPSPSVLSLFTKRCRQLLRIQLALLAAISSQSSALAVALSNLDRHNQGKKSGIDAFHLFAKDRIETHESALLWYDVALWAVANVTVHPKLVPSRSSSHSSTDDHNDAANNSNSSQNKVARPTYLSDYISKDKIAAVKDSCAKLHADILARFQSLQDLLAQVSEGAQLLRNEYEANDLEDLKECKHDVEVAHRRSIEITEALSHRLVAHSVSSATRDQDDSDPDNDLQLALEDAREEARMLDDEAINRIKYLVDRKNDTLRQLVDGLQRIAKLQSSISSFPPITASLHNDLRTKSSGFLHLARLQAMIPAYATTLAEIVRRRHFNHLISSHSHSLVNLMGKLISSEKKRRAAYRDEVAGKLPWEVKGLGVDDSAVPFIDVEVRWPSASRSLTDGSSSSAAPAVKESMHQHDNLPEINKEDIVAFENVLQEMQDALDSSPDAPRPLQAPIPPEYSPAPTYAAQMTEANPIKEAKLRIQKFYTRMEQMEKNFARVEPFLTMSDSMIAQRFSTLPGSGTTAVASDNNGELKQQLESTNQEIDRLKHSFSSREQQLKTRIEEKEDELSRHRHEEAVERVRLNQKLEELSKDLAAERTKSHSLEGQLARAQDDQLVEQKRADQLSLTLQSTSDRLAELDSTHQKLAVDFDSQRNELEHLKQKSELLQTRVTSYETLQKELNDVLVNKDQTLRDHRSEAQLDKATLEEIINNLKREVENVTNEKQELETYNATLIEQKRTTENANEAQLNQLQAKLDTQHTLLLDACKVACSLRGGHDSARSLLASTTASSTSIHLNSNSSTSSSPSGKNRRLEGKEKLGDNYNEDNSNKDDEDDGDDSSSSRGSIDWDNDSNVQLPQLSRLVDSLQSYDAALTANSIKAKVDSLAALVKKWQKETKAYRDRAQKAYASANEKIAFRNFTVGDLALFLPTRNLTAQIWAAFNVSFPHYFLQPSGAITEQIKTREWIVARISSIAEKTADTNDPGSNPYSLPNGTKYSLLQVEGWAPGASSSSAGAHGSHRHHHHRHHTSSRKKRSSDEKSTSSSSPQKTPTTLLQNNDTVAPTASSTANNNSNDDNSNDNDNNKKSDKSEDGDSSEDPKDANTQRIDESLLLKSVSTDPASTTQNINDVNMNTTSPSGIASTLGLSPNLNARAFSLLTNTLPSNANDLTRSEFTMVNPNNTTGSISNGGSPSMMTIAMSSSISPPSPTTAVAPMITESANEQKQETDHSEQERRSLLRSTGTMTIPKAIAKGPSRRFAALNEEEDDNENDNDNDDNDDSRMYATSPSTQVLSTTPADRALAFLPSSRISDHRSSTSSAGPIDIGGKSRQSHQHQHSHRYSSSVGFAPSSSVRSTSSMFAPASYTSTSSSPRQHIHEQQQHDSPDPSKQHRKRRPSTVYFLASSVSAATDGGKASPTLQLTRPEDDILTRRYQSPRTLKKDKDSGDVDSDSDDDNGKDKGRRVENAVLVEERHDNEDDMVKSKIDSLVEDDCELGQGSFMSFTSLGQSPPNHTQQQSRTSQLRRLFTQKKQQPSSVTSNTSGSSTTTVVPAPVPAPVTLQSPTSPKPGIRQSFDGDADDQRNLIDSLRDQLSKNPVSPSSHSSPNTNSNNTADLLKKSLR